MKMLILITLLISFNTYAGDLTEVGGGGRTTMTTSSGIWSGNSWDKGPINGPELENMDEYLDAKDLMKNGIRNFRFEDGSNIYLPRAISNFESARF